MDLDTFRDGIESWIVEHETDLQPPAAAEFDMDSQMDHLSQVKRLAYDAGWMRWGWPERIGGFGGSTLMRAQLGEALTSRGFVEPGIYSMTEVLAPTMITFASPELAADMVPRLLRGDETWCQGFSEPGTGSDLGALETRATRVEEGWRVSGQKIWTSLAQYAQRCVLLVRTGAQDDGNRGITALFVDMDSAGITVRPLPTQHGVDEFCEVFFDEVFVPGDRILGEEGGGWSVAKDLLPYERSTSLWHRGAYLEHRVERLLAETPGELDPGSVGDAVLRLFAFRARSRETQYRMAAGDRLGAETSIDKIMLGTTEQAVFDLVESGLAADIVLGDDERSARWRSDFLYSRAATIYGGTVDIQRNIVARRVLDLGAER